MCKCEEYHIRLHTHTYTHTYMHSHTHTHISHTLLCAYHRHFPVRVLHGGHSQGAGGEGTTGVEAHHAHAGLCSHVHPGHLGLDYHSQIVLEGSCNSTLLSNWIASSCIHIVRAPVKL